MTVRRLALGAATLFLLGLWLWHVSGELSHQTSHETPAAPPGERGKIVRQATAELVVPGDPSRTDAVATVTERVVRVSVTSVARVPVNDASVSILSRARASSDGDGLQKVDGLQPVARTGSDGVANLRLEAGSQLDGVCVVAPGFVPAVVTDVQGDTIQVVLEEESVVEFFVCDAQGAPVKGFAISIGSGPVARSDVARASDGGFHASAAGVLVAGARSGDDGLIRVRAKRGGVHPVYNADGGAFIVDNLRDIIRVESPASGVRVAVSKPLAAAFRLVGDEAVAVVAYCEFGGRFAGDAATGRARNAASYDLGKRLPGAQLVCEVGDGKGGDAVAVVRCFGRFSGWTSFRLAMRPFDEVREAATLSMAGGQERRTGLLMIRLTDPDGAEYPLFEGDLRLLAETPEGGVSFEHDPAGGGEVPAGRLRVLLGHEGLGLGIHGLSRGVPGEDAPQVLVSPGGSVELPLQLDRPMRRVALSLRVAGNAQFPRASIEYSDARGVVKRRLLSGDPRVVSWVQGPVLKYTLRAEGWGSWEGEVPVDYSLGPQTIQEREILLPEKSR